jgi:hypothetical protein
MVWSGLVAFSLGFFPPKPFGWEAGMEILIVWSYKVGSQSQGIGRR